MVFVVILDLLGAFKIGNEQDRVVEPRDGDHEKLSPIFQTPLSRKAGMACLLAEVNRACTDFFLALAKSESVMIFSPSR